MNQIIVNNDELIARALNELERRQKTDPTKFYEPANAKIEEFHRSTAKTKSLFGANRPMAYGTFVRMGDGSSKPIEELVIGDIILAWNGKESIPTRITDIPFDGNRPIFEIVTANGLIIRADDSHEFPVKNGKGKIVKKSVRELISHVRSSFRLCNGGIQNYNISEELPFSGLLLGLYLGDGSFGKTPSNIYRARPNFTNTDNEIMNLWKREIKTTYPELHCRIYPSDKTRAYISSDGKGHRNRFVEDLIKLGLDKQASEKKIPNSFLIASPDVRKDILRGLILTDGCVDKHKVCIYTSSCQLVQDIDRLLVSLGIYAKIYVRPLRSDQHNVSYVIQFAITDLQKINLTNLLRKTPAYIKRSNPRFGVIESIKYIGEYRARCITIDHPNHCFVLANGIVTSNSGKTEAAIQELIWHLDGSHPYKKVPPAPVYWRVVVVDYGQLEKVVNEKLMRMLPKRLFINGKWESSYNDRKHILSLSNGSKVDFMTHEQPVLAFEGSARHGTLFDEEPPQDIYTSCIMRHADYDGITLMAMTPLHGLTYTYDEIYLKSFSSKNVDAWTISIYENRFLTASAIEEIESKITDDVDRQIRLYGKFMSRTGLVFKAFDPAVHVYKAPESEDDPYYQWWDGIYPPHHWFHVIGIDPGWDHPTGVIWTAIDYNGDRWVYREHKQAGWLPEDHAELIKAYNEQMRIKNPIYVIDSQAKAIEQSSGSNVWGEYRDNGIICRLGTKKLLDGNLKLAEYMKVTTDNMGNKHTHYHISNECPMFIAELGKYQRAKTTPMNATERFIDKDNDLISAARYANWEADRVFDGDSDDYNRNYDRKGSKRTGY